MDDLGAGVALARVPAGRYIRYCIEDETPQVAFAWSSLWQTEADHTIQRAYHADRESYLKPDIVEIYIALT